MKALAIALAAGLLFGAGLSWSGMTDPARIFGFLELADPTLAFVMGGALAVTVPGFALAQRLAHPLAAAAFAPSPATAIDRPLWLGSALFGTGWGLAGICPGPALANLSLGDLRVFAFVFAMVGAAWAQRALTKR